MKWSEIFAIILSRVYGSVTNNIGFWIGWLDLLTASFTITRNHNQLQYPTINLQPNSSSLTAEDSLHSRSSSTTDFWVLSLESWVLSLESYITTDDQSASLSWNEAPNWGLRPDFYYCQLLVCWCGALSLTRWRVCRLQLLMVLASADIFGSDSRGTRDRILLSHCQTQRRYRTQYGKHPPSGNAIRRWLKQFKETGNVLLQKGAGRPHIAGRCWSNPRSVFSKPKKSTRRASLQLGIAQTAVWSVVHNHLQQVIKLFEVHFHIP
jgi:hypothetical protein